MGERIFLCSSGLGYIPRGLEIFTADLFNKLKHASLDVWLLQGAGEPGDKTINVLHLRRNYRMTIALAKIVRRNPYEIQNFTFALGMVFSILKLRPALIYTGEPVVYTWLSRIRKLFRLKFRMIFFTGGQTIPSSFSNGDFLHHVTPSLFPLAEARNIRRDNQFLLPHFIDLQMFDDFSSDAGRVNLPEGRKIILSVGAVDQSVKRMKYVIDEVSKLPIPVFLVIAGAQESETPSVLEHADNTLGRKNFLISTFDRRSLYQLYKKADAFVLASLNEGFGLVYLEALAAGVRIITHNHAAAQYVVGNFGLVTDLSKNGQLTNALTSVIEGKTSFSATNQQQYVRTHFAWDVLKDDYLRMFTRAIQQC